MSKRFLYIHFGFAFLTLLALLAELVHFIFVYPDMPETIGMHFGPDGDFDVHAEKLYGLYPYVMGGFLIGVLLLADRFVLKLKLGLDYDKKGEDLVRAAVLLATNGVKAYICIFFLEWSDAVIHQHGTKGRINVIGAIVFLVFFISALALGSYAKRKYRGLQLHRKSPVPSAQQKNKMPETCNPFAKRCLECILCGQQERYFHSTVD